ncbi:MAG: hypothetical protein ACP5JP_04100 [bacterium]
MKKNKTTGFNYYLSKVIINDYRKRPLELRLQWLYMGNLFRMSYPEKIRKLHERFRLT